MSDFATIDPVLSMPLKRGKRWPSCNDLTTDASYGKCVQRRATGPEFEPSPQEVNVGARFVSKGSPLVTEDIFGGVIEGNGLRKGARLCVPSEKKNPLGCRVELDFPLPEEIEQFNLPAGTPAVIRKCVEKKEDGPLVPVSTIDQALAVTQEFCGCVGPKPTDGKRRKCARK